jgi:hypothetical protein
MGTHGMRKLRKPLKPPFFSRQTGKKGPKNMNRKQNRRSFRKDVGPADDRFVDAVKALQFGWKHDFGRAASRYEKQCFENLMKVTRRLPRRDLEGEAE